MARAAEMCGSMVAMVVLAGRVQVFGVEHLVILAAAAIGCGGAFALGRRADPAVARRWELAAGVAVLVVCIPFTVYDWRRGPEFQICDFAWIVAVGALLTRGSLWSATTYFWGLTLCIQGVLTPDLSEGFPSVAFWSFVVRHLVPVWVGVHLIGARRGPSWRGLGFTAAITALWAAAMMVLNALRGSNYGYLNAKPSTPSLLDLLGPWPWYVVAEIAVVIGVWALMTWPWNRGSSPHMPPR